MLVFAFLATLVPSITTSWISYLQNKRSLAEKITGELQSVSAQTARETDLWVKERLYELRVFASSYEVSENLDRVSRPAPDRARARLTDFLRSVREHFPDYQELVAVNPEGGAAATTAKQPTAVRLPRHWATTIRAEHAVVGEAYVDRDGEYDDPFAERAVYVRFAHDRVLGADGRGPVPGEANRAGLLGGRRRGSSFRVHRHELLVVREVLPHRAQEIREPRAGAVWGRAGNPVQVLRHLVRAREHAELVQPLLHPQVGFTRRLRADALQLARDLLGERALVLQIGNPRRGERGDDRGEHAEHDHLATDAVQP